MQEKSAVNNGDYVIGIVFLVQNSRHAVEIIFCCKIAVVLWMRYL